MKEASSINISRSIVYGLATILTIFQYILQKLRLMRFELFRSLNKGKIQMLEPKVQRKATTQREKAQDHPLQVNASLLQRHVPEFLIGLCLILVILAVFWPVKNYEFVNFDDDLYVADNSYVKAGLTLKSVSWAFRTMHASNWHPLTWLSHMLDCELYGLNPGKHHLTNLLFHIGNAVLLFLVLKRMTGALWKSSFVAALFALHPLHVESVAWVAERKDVLSTFFWILTIWTYVWYIEQPRIDRYLLTLLFFALGLFSKPMLVTLPFTLLLFDYWPLGRFQFRRLSENHNPHSSKSINPSNQRLLIFRLVLEKIPFFTFSAVSSFLTFFTQQKGGSVKSFELFSLGSRIGNALVSYVNYIEKMIWPHHLAVLYPHPGMLPIWQVIGAGLLLGCVSVVSILSARRRPYLVVGWLWYLGTLIPVIGLVQIGIQAMADRYTYVPLIGLFVMIAWGVPNILLGLECRRIVLAISAGLLLLTLTTFTMLQIKHWTNTITLFTHSLKVTVNNYIVHNNLGNALAGRGKDEEAIAHYVEALRIKPYFAEAHINLGNALVRQEKYQEAMDHYTESLRIMPNSAKAHSNLGVALVRQERYQEAIAHYAEALRIKSDYADAHYNLGNALALQKKYQEAIAHFAEALRIIPDFAEAHFSLGWVYLTVGNRGLAMEEYEVLKKIDPGLANTLCQKMMK
jgi:Flp pilus assembly protein TadD